LAATTLSKNVSNYKSKLRTVASSSNTDFSIAKFPSVLNKFLAIPKALNTVRSVLFKSSYVAVVCLSAKSIASTSAKVVTTSTPIARLSILTALL